MKKKNLNILVAKKIKSDNFLNCHEIGEKIQNVHHIFLLIIFALFTDGLSVLKSIEDYYSEKVADILIKKFLKLATIILDRINHSRSEVYTLKNIVLAINACSAENILKC